MYRLSYGNSDIKYVSSQDGYRSCLH
jgi:hypothetical protein